MADGKKTAIIAVFSLAVFLVLIILAWIRPYSSHPTGVSDGARITRAEEGSFIPTLPKELILDASVAPKESRIVTLGDKEFQTTENYSIKYPDGVLQSTGNYESQKSLSELAGIYENFMNNNGWSIINRTTYPFSRGFYAKKGSQDLSVSIIDRSSTREVSVSYLERR